MRKRMKPEKTENRMKGDNLVLYIVIIILLAVALLVGASYGYELGVKMCNNYYLSHIKNNCVCYTPMDVYKTERVIPQTMSNLSAYDR